MEGPPSHGHEHDFVTVLRTSTLSQRLCKRHYLEQGELKTSGYGTAYLCFAERIKVSNIRELGRLIESIENSRRRCVIRGDFDDEAEQPLRRIMYKKEEKDESTGEQITIEPTITPAPRRWAMIDLDNLQAPDGYRDGPHGIEVVRYARETLGGWLKDVTCYYQFSNSAGVRGWDKVKLHLWFWMDRHVSDDLMRLWARRKKRAGLRLVDTSVFSANQPNYTANPFFDEGVQDPFKGHKRSGFCQGESDVAIFPRSIAEELNHKERRLEREKARTAWLPPVNNNRREAFMRVVCDDWRDRLINSGEGSRHGMALVCAKVLFGFVNRGWLSEHEVRSVLDSSPIHDLRGRGQREIDGIISHARRNFIPPPPHITLADVNKLSPKNRRYFKTLEERRRRGQPSPGRFDRIPMHPDELPAPLPQDLRRVKRGSYRRPQGAPPSPDSPRVSMSRSMAIVNGARQVAVEARQGGVAQQFARDVNERLRAQGQTFEVEVLLPSDRPARPAPEPEPEIEEDATLKIPVQVAPAWMDAPPAQRPEARGPVPPLPPEEPEEPAPEAPDDLDDYPDDGDNNEGDDNNEAPPGDDDAHSEDAERGYDEIDDGDDDACDDDDDDNNDDNNAPPEPDEPEPPDDGDDGDDGGGGEVDPGEFPKNDVHLAGKFLRMYGDVVRRNPTFGWMVYDGKIWVRDIDSTLVGNRVTRSAVDLTEEIRLSMPQGRDFFGLDKAVQKQWQKAASFANSACNNSRIHAVISQASKSLEIRFKVPELDDAPFLFNVNNGTIDLRTGELLPHRPSDLITKISEIDYDPDAKCPAWEQFICEIMDEDPEMVGYLHRAVGYAMTGDTTEQCFFLLTGKGSNGKSTFLSLLRQVIGNYYHTAQFSSFVAKRDEGVRNDIADMRSPRLVAAVEPPHGVSLNAGLVKQLSGEDEVSARFLFKEAFRFIPKFKLFLACNDLPRINDSSFGIWRRIKVIPFLRQWAVGPNDPPEWPKADRGLAARLKAELPGILTWAVRGCAQWLEYGLEPPQRVLDASEKYQGEQDTISAFVRDLCIEGLLPTGNQPQVPRRKLYDLYRQWAEEEGLKAFSNKNFKKHLLNRNGISEHRTNKAHVYLGIGICKEKVDANIGDSYAIL